MEPDKLLEMLGRAAAKKGYCLHADREHCLGTAEGLIANRERYGYMCCPCRLASEDKETDRDIICPCLLLLLLCFARAQGRPGLLSGHSRTPRSGQGSLTRLPHTPSNKKTSASGCFFVCFAISMDFMASAAKRYAQPMNFAALR